MARENYTFSAVPSANIPRSTFNRSHGHKTTFNAGRLVPIFVDEVLPGDTFNVRASVLARLATPIHPLMDNLYLDFFFFFVPNRLIWDNWQKFCGEQENPGDSIDFLVPQIEFSQDAPQVELRDTADYFGIPVGSDTPVNALHFRAYNLIWNEWFRSEDLQDRVLVPKDDGPDDYDECKTVLRRGKRHDYFTSCLPWPQKGPGVGIRIAETAPVIADVGMSTPSFVVPAGSGGSGIGVALTAAAGDPSHLVLNDDVTGGGPVQWMPGRDISGDHGNSGLVADLTDTTSVTINALRQAFQIQKLLERDARGGTRYIELLRSHFGVMSPDMRLQRPEYLGGGSVPVHVNPVMQTSATDAGVSPQGNLAAYGVAVGKGIGFTKSFVEHGVLIGLMCARADLTYQQGLHRMWSRRSRYDYYWPAFANLGEQAVLNKEIYLSGNAEVDDAVFGYQERWAEYRYFPSKVTGLLRSSLNNGLDSWHLAQEFGATPELGNVFIQENPPIERVVAVPSEDDFICDSHFSIKCTRPMPVYSVPGMIDHF